MANFELLSQTTHDLSLATVLSQTPTLSPAQLPDQFAPDLSGFLNDHGIDPSGGNTNSGSGINIPGFGNGSNGGSGIDIPGMGGNNGSDGPSSGHGDLSGPGVPDGIHIDGGLSGVGVPKGLDFGNQLSGLGVPKGLDIGDGLFGVGVPDDVRGGGGIISPAVPGGQGSVGVGGFSPSDFDNAHLTDSPNDSGVIGGKDAGGWLDSAWSNLSSGHALTAGWDLATAIVADGDARRVSGVQDHDWGERLAGGMEDAVGGATAAVVTGGAVVAAGAAGPIGVVVAVVANAVTPDPAPQPKDDGKPDPGKGNQPVDDSGTGPSHPSTHGAEQPVDDTGGGSGGFHPLTSSAALPVDDSGNTGGGFHPLASTTAQPVDDFGVTPSHPGTHLGASFWDAAAQVVADSQQHAAAASTSTPVADASAASGHSGSLGTFEHGAASFLASSATPIDSHAGMDALSSTHAASAMHVEADHGHSFQSLDTSHLALHM